MTPSPDDAPLCAAEQRTLAALLDELVPPAEDAGLPGAGELGLAASVGEELRTRLGAALREALRTLDARAREAGVEGFATLAREARAEVLRALEARAPGLLAGLALPTYVAYYQQPRVLEALGLEPRPPFPKGHAVPPTDFSILDPVRRRAPFYRRASDG
jgi:hypothetical protein